MKLLVTWWMWFIGSHTVVELVDAWYEVIILDNLTNSKPQVLSSIEKITGKLPMFYEGDVRDEQLVEKIFTQHDIVWVFHFAAKKAVGESCSDPWAYYSTNLLGLQVLTKSMRTYGCTRLIFSSSCTVYDPLSSQAPFNESAPTWNCFSPYGTTKYVSELLLRDLFLHQWFSAINLRYFNPIGAHHSWLLGEDSAQPPTNLLPVIFQTVQGKRAYVEIFGDTYATPDGTCLRDYIHVVDLADAHIAAWKRMIAQEAPVYEAFNIGTWTPTSVKELVAIVQKVTTQSVNMRLVAPRAWDIPVAYAYPQKAQQWLWWTAKKSVEDAVMDGWGYIQHSKPTT